MQGTSNAATAEIDFAKHPQENQQYSAHDITNLRQKIIISIEQIDAIKTSKTHCNNNLKNVFENENQHISIYLNTFMALENTISELEHIGKTYKETLEQLDTLEEHGLIAQKSAFYQRSESDKLIETKITDISSAHNDFLKELTDLLVKTNIQRNGHFTVLRNYICENTQNEANINTFQTLLKKIKEALASHQDNSNLLELGKSINSVLVHLATRMLIHKTFDESEQQIRTLIQESENAIRMNLPVSFFQNPPEIHTRPTQATLAQGTGNADPNDRILRWLRNTDATHNHNNERSRSASPSSASRPVTAESQRSTPTTVAQT